MRLMRLTAENYRNLVPLDFTPSPDVNILCGDNGQGKTNILEAIWLFTGGRSFRGAKDGEAVSFGKEYARLCCEFESGQREQSAQINIVNRRRSVTLNKKKQKSTVSLVGRFCAVVFSPDHLSLIKDGPSNRRNFLDAAICQNDPVYAALLMRYNRVLAQRNALLKSACGSQPAPDTLDAWDAELCEYAGKILTARFAYLERFSPRAAEIYAGISESAENLSIKYECLYCEDNKVSLQDELKKSRRCDLALGYTTAGPHRDDLTIRLSGNDTRMYASQGQQRSVVLAMKLAEAAVLEETLGEPPVILLDDVMSELDHNRQEYLKNNITGRQVFITCCEPIELTRSNNCNLLYVRDGEIYV